jgi:hypothetical protein
MASARQIAANRRNAQKSRGPVSEAGKQRSSMNALQHGMTARVIVLPHEDDIEYHEIRASLLESYAPANAHERMLVDQIAAGYWRTLRARRFETALLTEGARTYKQNHGKSTEPNARQDDSVCAVWMVQMSPEKLKNYFRYEGSIERQYYRAIAALEKAQAARLRREQHLERTLRNAPPDTIAELSSEPPPPNIPAVEVSENGIGSDSSEPDAGFQAAASAPQEVHPIGTPSLREDGTGDEEPPPGRLQRLEHPPEAP